MESSESVHEDFCGKTAGKDIIVIAYSERLHEALQEKLLELSSMDDPGRAPFTI